MATVQAQLLIANAQPSIRRVLISNFRSIEKLTLNLDPVTLLVGRNGAGKSNILDAIAFVADASVKGLTAAIGQRDGIDAVRRRTPGTRGLPCDVRVELDIDLVPPNERFPLKSIGYGLTLGARSGGEWHVKEEWLAGEAHGGPRRLVMLRSGDDINGVTSHSEPADDQLALPHISGPEAFYLRTGLGLCHRYSFNTADLREPQPFSSDARLLADGKNLNHVWAKLEREAPETATRIVTLLQQVVPELEELHATPAGRYAILEGV